MKKLCLLLLILVLAATPLLFAACSNVSQRDKLMPGYSCADDGYELFTYNVFSQEQIVGEMTMKFEPLTKKSVDLPSAEGDKHFDSVSGTLLSTDLAMQNGDTVTSRVLYDGNFTPIFSYKRTSVGGTVKEMQVRYEGKYLYAERFEAGSKVSSYREKLSGYYDNEMLYALVRASSIGDSSYSLSFSVANALTGSTDSMSITKIGEVKESIKALEPREPQLAEGETSYTVPCYSFRISTGNQYAGSYTMTVTKDRQTVENDTLNIVNVKKIITTITEGDYKYILKDVEIA